MECCEVLTPQPVVTLGLSRQNYLKTGRAKAWAHAYALNVRVCGRGRGRGRSGTVGLRQQNKNTKQNAKRDRVDASTRHEPTKYQGYVYLFTGVHSTLKCGGLLGSISMLDT